MIFVAVALVLVAIGASVFVPSGDLWWWRDRDPEQRRGFGVITAVFIAFGVVLTMLFLPTARPWLRVVCALASIGAALLIASTNWTRSVLRRTVLVLLALTALIIVQIGRDALIARPALDTLAAARTTRARLVTPVKNELVRLRKAQERAVSALDRTIHETPKAAKKATTLALVVAHDLGAKSVNRPQLELDVKRLHDLPPLDAASASKAHKAALRKLAASLRKAVASAVAAETALEKGPNPKDFDTAIVKASCILEHTTYADAPTKTGCKKRKDGNDLDGALADLRLQEAKYQQLVLHRPLDKEAVKSAEKDVETLATTTIDHSTSVLDALRAGGEAVASDLPGQHSDVPISLEGFGLTLSAAVALGFWRRIERRSAQQMPGPVSITLKAAPDPKPATADAGSGTDAASAAQDLSGDQEAIFRVAVLQNLPEPGAAPGASALQQVTDLAPLAGAAGAGIGKLLAVIKNIVARPGGYIVDALVVAPSDGNVRWQVLTRISDQWSGEQVAMRTVTDVNSAAAACRIAGYWAAAKILSFSSRVPGWASWDEGTETALAAYEEGDNLTIGTLEDALAKAPTSGLLLSQLASAYDVAGRHVDALALNARAVAAHPHFWIAHYRLAVSAGMVSTEVDDEWLTMASSERVRVSNQLERACNRLNVVPDGEFSWSHLRSRDKDQVKKAFESVNSALLKRLQENAKPAHLLSRLLRKDERIVWWPVARTLFTDYSFGAAARAKWLPLSARIMDELPAKELQTICKQARKPRSWWQLSYNLACYHARHNDPDKALGWLEIALEHPGSGQMTGEWIKADPDLEKIRTQPRFQWVLGQLEPSTRSVADG